MADSAPTGLMGVDPDMLLSIGSGLLSMGHYGTDPGKAMQGAMQNYYATKQAKQTMQMNQLNMQALQAQMPQIQAFGSLLAQKMGRPSPQNGQGPQAVPLAQQQAQQPAAQPAFAPSSVPTIPGAPTGLGSAPPITPAPVQQSPQSQGAQQPQQAPGSNGLWGLSADDAEDLSVLGAGLPFGVGEQAKALGEYAKYKAGNDPALATRMESAKSQVTQDQYQIQQAQAQGNTTLAAGLQQKMRQDLGLLHIASMSGTQTRIGLGGDISTYNPNEGVQTNNGVESVIPGATQARGQLAAAESIGKAAGETVEVTDKDGNKYLVPKSTIVGGARSTGNTSGAGSTGAPGALAGISPGAARMRVGNADQALETNKEFQKQADAGNSMLSQVQTLRNSAADFTPGRFADSRATMLDYLNSTGLISGDQKKALGSYQEGQKIAIQLQAAATKQLGSREAAQVFQYMGKSLPNLTLSSNGLEKVSAWQEGISRYQIARAEDANNKAQANDAQGVNQTQNNWVKGSNPLFYVFASAKPDVRQEMLTALGANKQKFVTQWNQAARSGMAPMPNDYWPQ